MSLVASQAEGQGVLVQPEFVGLHQSMWARQAAAVERASEARQRAAALARQRAARGPLGDVARCAAAPPAGAELYPHQLQALNALRRAWAVGKHAIVADEPVRARAVRAVHAVRALDTLCAPQLAAWSRR